MELISTYICKASDVGVHNNMFGGTMMSIIDQSSGAYAAQICDTPRMVTVKVNELIFNKPVKVGNILKVYGKVEEFGRTSVTLYVEVRKHNVYTGEQEKVTETKIKFVKIDDDAKPIPLPELVKTRYRENFEKYGKGLISKYEK